MIDTLVWMGETCKIEDIDFVSFIKNAKITYSKEIGVKTATLMQEVQLQRILFMYGDFNARKLLPKDYKFTVPCSLEDGTKYTLIGTWAIQVHFDNPDYPVICLEFDKYLEEKNND